MNPRIVNAKRQGEYAEMKFQVEGFEHGLALSKPFGESMPYDYIADNGKRLLKIQIKSVSAHRQRAYKVGLHAASKLRWRVPGKRVQARRHWIYPIAMHQGHRVRGYQPSEIDFVAALVIPEEVWYIIPVRAIKGRVVICVFPNNPDSKGMFERYKEAWHLLQ